jgi:hypothetical protein
MSRFAYLTREGVRSAPISRQMFARYNERYLGVWIKGLAGALLPRPTLKAASPDSERY